MTPTLTKEEIEALLATCDMAAFDKATCRELCALALRAIARLEKAEAALTSIAANTCCEGCREAALVARTTLTKLQEALDER